MEFGRGQRVYIGDHIFVSAKGIPQKNIFRAMNRAHSPRWTERVRFNKFIGKIGTFRGLGEGFLPCSTIHAEGFWEMYGVNSHCPASRVQSIFCPKIEYLTLFRPRDSEGDFCRVVIYMPRVFEQSMECTLLAGQ